MSVLVVVVFDKEVRTADYVRSLRGLHNEGRITVFASATLARTAGGMGPTPRMPVSSTEAIAGRAVAAAVGTLVSLLGGPLTAAMRAAPLGLVAVVRDLDDAGLDARFLEQVSHDLPAGGGAVVAEVEELQPLVLDTLGLQQKGRVLRYRLAGAFVVRRLAAEIRALRRELSRLQTQKRVPEDAITNLKRNKSVELAWAVRRARNLAGCIQRESDAKRSVFQNQALRLEPARRQALQRRAAAAEARLKKLAVFLERAAESG